MPDLNWNGDADTAPFSSYYDGGSGNLVLAEDNTGGVVLLEYDDTAGEWVHRADVDLGGNTLTGGDVEATGAFIDSLGNQVSDFESLGGVKYVQTAEPAYVEGDTWLNPDTGVFYVGYNGEYRPVPPVTVTQEASTFTESDVTVSNDGTVVSNGGIELDGVNSGSAIVSFPSPVDVKAWDLATYQSTADGGSVTVDVLSYSKGTTATRPEDDGSLGARDNANGLEINPNTALGGVSVTLSGNTPEVSTVLITDASKNILAESTGTYSAGDVVELIADLSAGTDYYVGVRNGGSNYEPGRTTSVSYPYASGDIDITTGALDFHPDDPGSVDLSSVQAISITEVEALETPTEYTDISQNFDISTVPASSIVNLRANLSRQDTSNNPTLGYLARRFTR